MCPRVATSVAVWVQSSVLTCVQVLVKFVSSSVQVLFKLFKFIQVHVNAFKPVQVSSRVFKWLRMPCLFMFRAQSN